ATRPSPGPPMRLPFSRRRRRRPAGRRRPSARAAPATPAAGAVTCRSTARGPTRPRAGPPPSWAAGSPPSTPRRSRPSRPLALGRVAAFDPVALVARLAERTRPDPAGPPREPHAAGVDPLLSGGLAGAHPLNVSAVADNGGGPAPLAAEGSDLSQADPWGGDV